jgi:flagellar hook-basal body complex protein FliE
MSSLPISPVAVPGISTPTIAPVGAPSKGADATGASGFGDALSQALSGVNDLQVRAEDAASALARGEHVDMTHALVTIEKANITFQFAMQVRNKLLEAYQEIMRMPV